MIYQVYWGTVSAITVVSKWNQAKYPNHKVGDVVPASLNQLADAIKGSEGDTVLFTLSNHNCSGEGRHQSTEFWKWVKEHELEPYIVVNGKEITNPIHPERNRNLELVVMQSLDLIEERKKECTQ